MDTAGRFVLKRAICSEATSSSNPAQEDRLTKRLEIAAFGITPSYVDIHSIVEAVEARMKAGVSTVEIDNYAIQISMNSAAIHPAYSWIAAHIEVDNMHRTMQPMFSQSVKAFQDDFGKRSLSKEFLEVVEKNHRVLDAAIIHLRDYDHTYGAVKHMQDHFLGRKDGQVVERIQHMYMRTAVAIHLHDIPSVLSTYELLSSRQLTLDAFVSLSAGTKERFMSATHSMALAAAHVQDLFDAITRAVFSTRRGGTVAISAQGLPCNGRNSHCRHKSSFTRRQQDDRTDLINVALDVWHVDIRAFVDFNTMHRHDLAEQKSVTTTVCIPNIFMTRVKSGGEWSMFCPSVAEDLLHLSGPYFSDAYERYEASSTPRVKMRAKDLWDTILRSIILTGGPSIIFKDNLNGMSPSCHSDMRTGMIDVLSEEDELYPRNHSSVALPLFVTRNGRFNFENLHQVTKEAVYILNKALDLSLPHLVARMDHNKDYRVIAVGSHGLAVGSHGLADVFTAMRMPYESLEAVDLNVQIAETMYHAALEASWELAVVHGAYENFLSSPLANGMMQFNFWDVTPTERYDWRKLSDRIRASGVRNASLIAIGAGSGAQWSSGFTPSTEPLPSNLLDGHILCPWLVDDLDKLGLWNDTVREAIVAADGSIQQISAIPGNIKAIYRTAWEVDPKSILKMVLGRAPFVCHSQNVSFHMETPTIDQLDELMMRAWTSGLKSGIHRLHARFPEQNREETPSSYELDDTDREMSFDDVLVPSSP
ncbi:ribonucleotide reductase [Mycena filopes]|nr:ribonucleotide reductase [Mycena filopes]